MHLPYLKAALGTRRVRLAPLHKTIVAKVVAAGAGGTLLDVTEADRALHNAQEGVSVVPAGTGGFTVSLKTLKTPPAGPAYQVPFWLWFPGKRHSVNSPDVDRPSTRRAFPTGPPGHGSPREIVQLFL